MSVRFRTSLWYGYDPAKSGGAHVATAAQLLGVASCPGLSPIGLLAEPPQEGRKGVKGEEDWTPKNWGTRLIASARRQAAVFASKGVTELVINDEKGWGDRSDGKPPKATDVIAGGVRVATVIEQLAHGDPERNVEPVRIAGVYGAVVNDFDAMVEPEKDRLERNTKASQYLDHLVTRVEVDAYTQRMRSGAAYAAADAYGGAVRSVVAPTRYMVRQGQLLYPGTPCRVWMSDQCLPGAFRDPVTDVPPWMFEQMVKGVAALPGVAEIVFFSGFNPFGKPDGTDMALPMTIERRRCLEIFAEIAARAA